MDPMIASPAYQKPIGVAITGPMQLPRSGAGAFREYQWRFLLLLEGKPRIVETTGGWDR